MGASNLTLIPALISCTICSACALGGLPTSTSFSVDDYGAVGDGCLKTSQAFVTAWKATCATTAANTAMIIPTSKTFLVYQITFNGPCRARNITFMIGGIVIAPSSPKAWEELDASRWLTFRSVNQLHVTGLGTVDGRGSGWWDQSCRYHPDLEGCTSLAPTAVKFFSCEASTLTNINFINSSQTHVYISGCRAFNIDNLLIQSPGNSPNTDGIHIQSSHGISITNAVIRSGDDCISIGDRVSNVYISTVFCGPGHGISIGSLGGSGNFVQVEDISISNVYFNHTTNGARIKTWQVGRGFLRRVTFQSILFNAVRNPIVIDQNYCFIRGACEEKQTGVHISKVAYIAMFGTSSTDVAVNLNCSRTIACTGLLLESILLTNANNGRQVNSSCTNAYGNSVGVVWPPSCLQG